MKSAGFRVAKGQEWTLATGCWTATTAIPTRRRCLRPLAGERRSRSPHRPTRANERMASDWFYEKNGSRHGPVSAAELRAMCADGRLAPGDLVWKETLPRWVKAAQLTGVHFNADDPFLAAGDVTAATKRGPAPATGSARDKERDTGAERPRGSTAGADAAAPPGSGAERADTSWEEALKGGRALFRNPIDGGKRVVSPIPTFLGCLLLGPVYFLLVGNRPHALRSLLLLPLTLGISHLVYPFFAPRIMRALYFARGWKRLA